MLNEANVGKGGGGGVYVCGFISGSSVYTGRILFCCSTQPTKESGQYCLCTAFQAKMARCEPSALF